MDLDEKLIKLHNSDMYPFHMPGAKRQLLSLPDPYSIDITEIPGFDNLNHPEDIYVEMNRRVADLYHADYARVIVNGSTGGNQMMIHAALKPYGTILVARNCHKSVWHEVELRRLHTITISPKMYTDSIPGVVSADDIASKLRQYPEIGAVVLTSPTYEGISSDIPAIAEACHKRGVVLLVDAAHGAHLTVGGSTFEKNPIELGADLAVVSLHKTLPALTQTSAVLYKDNPYVSREALDAAVPYYQSSSPSYVLTASVARCVRFLENEGEEAFQRLSENLKKFYEETTLSGLKLMPYENHDPSKIVIETSDGVRLANVLRQQYHLEPEFAVPDHVLMMATVADTEEGLKRLSEALVEIDGEEWAKSTGLMDPKVEDDKLTGLADSNVEEPSNPGIESEKRNPAKYLEIYEAMDRAHTAALAQDAVGRIAASQIAIYPPGIPLVLPGEVITEDVIDEALQARKQGLEVDGITDDGMVYILYK